MLESGETRESSSSASSFRLLSSFLLGENHSKTTTKTTTMKKKEEEKRDGNETEEEGEALRSWEEDECEQNYLVMEFGMRSLFVILGDQRGKRRTKKRRSNWKNCFQT